MTGSRGSGKTTLLTSFFPQPVPGVTTWAQPQEAVWLAENLTQSKAQIGRFNGALTGESNRMEPIFEGFTELGVPALERCITADREWAMIDEIGYLECGCTAYCDAIRRLMEHKRLIAAVRKQDLPFLTELCARDDVFVVNLDALFGQMACVIMASGEGKRFGSNKLMADFAGQPMITRALNATDGLFAKRVVVTRHEDVAALCRERSIHVIQHAFPHRSDTVRLGMEAIGEADGCLFLSGDQPLLRRETIAALLLCAANAPAAIWRTVHQGTHGAPVWFPKRFFDELLTLPEGMGGSYVIRQHPQLVRTLEADDPRELMDVDSPNDLAKLLNM